MDTFGTPMKNIKQHHYRQRRIKKGCCPHCGKPCAPYYECEDRREKKNINRMLNQMSRAKIITKEQDHPWEPALYKARRKWPRIGKKYVDITNLCEVILREKRGPLSVEELSELAMQDISIIKSAERAAKSFLQEKATP